MITWPSPEPVQGRSCRFRARASRKSRDSTRARPLITSPVEPRADSDNPSPTGPRPNPWCPLQASLDAVLHRPYYVARAHRVDMAQPCRPTAPGLACLVHPPPVPRINRAHLYCILGWGAGKVRGFNMAWYLSVGPPTCPAEDQAPHTHATRRGLSPCDSPGFNVCAMLT